MPVVLGVTGFKGCGKSEVRKYLARSYGFTHLPMAGPLKAMLAAIGLTDEQLNGSTKEVPCAVLCGSTPRHAMRTLGTEWGRMMVANNLWTHLWQQSAISCKTPLVTDDVRFENEFAAVRELGGKVLRVTRLGHQATAHASEAMMAELEPDYGITNNGSLIDLHRSIDRAVHVLRLGR